MTISLIIDDSEINNLLMVQALKPVAGCEPVSFTCPKAGLAFLRENVERIGVVVTDYDMPEMTGLDVIAAAREVPGFAHVPIVMVTGMDQRSLRHQALRAGATDFLGKPCDPVEIQARITNLMKISAAHRQEQDRAARLASEVAAAVAVIEDREREIIALLMRAAEHRDTDTATTSRACRPMSASSPATSASIRCSFGRSSSPPPCTMSARSACRIRSC